MVVRKAGAGPTDCYIKYTMTNARIVDYRTGYLNGNEIIPSDQFAMTFQKITMEYKPQKGDGKLGTGILATDDSDNTR